MSRSKFRILLIGLLTLGLAGCEDAYSGILILNGSHNYSSGEVIMGEMVLVSGNVAIQEGARLSGSVYMVGGDLQVDGEVGGDLSLIGGGAILGPTAFVEGGVNQAGGRLNIAPEAEVIGPVRDASDLSLDAESLFPQRSLQNRLVWIIPQALMVAILALVPARYFNKSLQRVSRAMLEHPLVAGAVGLLSGIVIPALLVLMAFTVILLPVTLLGLLAMVLVLGYGWMAAGAAVGRWLDKQTHRELRTTVAAFWGTFLFMLVVQALALIPFIGPTLSMFIGVVAIGAVLLTRFGTQTYIPSLDPELPEVEI
jgi:hypothetical protein